MAPIITTSTATSASGSLPSPMFSPSVPASKSYYTNNAAISAPIPKFKNALSAAVIIDRLEALATTEFEAKRAHLLAQRARNVVTSSSSSPASSVSASVCPSSPSTSTMMTGMMTGMAVGGGCSAAFTGSNE
ncbi:hypothetical protein HDU76_000368, partial [Blyttiomyces sp. JEL0837]